MWIEIRFRPNGGGPWFPDSFREFVAAKLCSDAPPRLFWMGEEGKPLPGAPRVTFVGSKGWVGVRVFKRDTDKDDESAAAALLAAPKIARALDQAFGGHHPVEIVHGEHEIKERKFTRYHIRKLVIPRNRSRKRYQDFLAALPEEGSGEVREIQPEFLPLLADVILSGIREQNAQTGGLFLSGLRFVEPPKWGAPVTAGGELAFVARDLTFILPHRITGPVQTGGLRTRGYGDIRRAIGEMSE